LAPALRANMKNNNPHTPLLRVDEEMEVNKRRVLNRRFIK
jgi:hypothetical protein